MQTTHLCEWKDLQNATYTFDSQFELLLADKQKFIAERIVRIVPNRRMVVFGEWQGRSVVAKIFFHPQLAKRQLATDLAGIEIFKQNKIPTPELLYQGTALDQRIQMAIFERIENAMSLEEVWHNQTSLDDILPQLRAVTVELATQHVLGVIQHDLHLKNFMITEKVIYMLDGGKVKQTSYLLPRKTSIETLALFLSQLGVGVEGLQEYLFRYYAKSRGWVIKQNDLIDLFLAIKKWNNLRWQKFQTKIFRSATHYQVQNSWKRNILYLSKYSSPGLIKLLENPEHYFHLPTTMILKNGRSSTVIKVEIDHKIYVVKRFNLKNVWHRIRRCLRHTRAHNSWRLAQKMQLFGVATAKPIAIIENKFFGFRGTSYYITEYVSSENLGTFLLNNKDHEKTNAMVKQVAALLKNVAKLEISHGDLKSTNILIDARERPVFIDLDGAVEHTSLSSVESAWRSEIKRFLKNFTKQPAIFAAFKAELNIQ